MHNEVTFHFLVFAPNFVLTLLQVLYGYGMTFQNKWCPAILIIQNAEIETWLGNAKPRDDLNV